MSNGDPWEISLSPTFTFFTAAKEQLRKPALPASHSLMPSKLVPRYLPPKLARCTAEAVDTKLLLYASASNYRPGMLIQDAYELSSCCCTVAC